MLIDDLRNWGADVDACMARFMNKESMYKKFLQKYLDSNEMEQLATQVESNDYDGILKTAHTMKGVAGNLGLSPILEPLQQMVDDIRANEYGNISSLHSGVTSNFAEFKKIMESNP